MNAEGTRLVVCEPCGGKYPVSDGPVHAYVLATPGCWAAFGAVQADEMTRYGYPPAHQLVVDAYMASHPGNYDDRRSRQSVVVHLVSICGLLERSWDVQRSREAMRRHVRKGDEFPAHERGPAGKLTVTHMTNTADVDEYAKRAHEWAEDVWQSWHTHHDYIRSLLT